MSTLFRKGAYVALIMLMCFMGCNADKTQSADKAKDVKHDMHISMDQAAAIAVAEVQKREDWTGEASSAVRKSDRWLVNVWAIPKKPGGFVCIAIGEHGEALDYYHGQ